MTAVSSLLILSCLAFADAPKSSPLLQTLPEDGEWVSFAITISVDGRELTPTWTTRSVGKTTHEGKPCRFVELEQTCETPYPPIYGVVSIGNQTWRFLVPEEEFGEGKHPLAHAVKIWTQNEKEAPVVVTSLAVRDPILDVILRGPSSHVKHEEQTEKITWQRGESTCSVISGSNETDFAGAKLRLDHRLLRQPEVPFGVAGMRQTITATFGAEEYVAKLTMNLRDHGVGAMPKLPQLVP